MSKKPELQTVAESMNTIRLHRVACYQARELYRAFLEADAMAKWLSPHGFTCTVQHMDPKVGANSGCRSRNFTTG